MLISTITQKGQVTIPASLREQLNLHCGDKVEFLSENGKVIVKKVKNDVKAAFGLYKTKRKVTLEEIEKAIEEGPLHDSD